MTGKKGRQSISSRLVPLYFRMLPKYSEDGARRELARMRAQAEPKPLAPRGIPYRYEQRADGGVFYLNERGASGRTVLYLHGGAYWHDFSPFHWRYLKRLIRRTDARVIAPAYRLAPHGTFRDAFALTVPLYRAYRAENPGQKLILMGDSAGGGMALALAEHFAAEGLPAPDELILFSPWTDVTMQNPAMQKLVPADPWLTVSLRVPGLCFADGADRTDYRINPLFGDLHALKNVLLVTGTRELLYPDTMLLYDGLKAEPSNELLVGQGMLHVYPLIPIPEAEAATRRVVERILR